MNIGILISKWKSKLEDNDSFCANSTLICGKATFRNELDNSLNIRPILLVQKRVCLHYLKLLMHI